MARGHYLNNKKLLECIRTYRAKAAKAAAEGRGRPAMPDYAGECILLICERMGHRSNFHGYSYRDEMIGDAIADCVQAFYNFDSDRFDNPFGYFSRVGWNAMLRKIHNEKRETYVKHKGFRESMLYGTQYDAPPDWQDPRATRAGAQAEATEIGQDLSDKVIDDFEQSLERRRERREKKEEEK